jgi:subtilase family protein
VPERDPLLFGSPRPGRRVKPGPRGRDKLQGPGTGRQAQRIGPQLQRITAALDAQQLRLRATPDALEPETILVLEIAGEVSTFAKAMLKVPGLEFLGEQALAQLDPDDDFRAVNQRGQAKRYSRQLFLIATDVRAWRELLGLWERFKRGDAMPHGLTAFRDLFAQLREVREWNDRDRLDRAGAADAWRRDLADLGDQLVPFEAELWLRRDLNRRAAVIDRLHTELRAVGGELVGQTVLQEIDYHGVLGRVPATRLLDAAASEDVSWLSTEGVRLFHATGQMVAPVVDNGEQADKPAGLGASPTGGTRLALLDGIPVAGHEALDGRLRIDDPDDWSSTVRVVDRHHGTLMASLVVHGDLGDAGDALDEPVYVRPILRPDPAAWFDDPPEMLPAGELPVDLIHRAVARLFEGDEPAAPETRVIVLAVADPSQQFDRFISPLARLVDWLSWHYNVLFVISAGNHTSSLTLPADIDTTNAAELEHEIIDAIRREALSRRLLAPGESANALTIGAAHDDASAAAPPIDVLDPFADTDLPSVISPIASGINRAIKPDLLLPGGRQPLRAEPVTDGDPRLLSVAVSRRPPGLRVAAPGVNGELDRYVHTTGTSGATALAGHAAGALLRRLDALRASYGADFPDAELEAVLLKAALAHTARWGTAAATIERILKDAGESASRAAIARFLGHGRARPELAIIADDHRPVLIHAGRLGVDDTLSYDLPLPPSLAGTTVERRLTLTLAWLTPINPRHRAYRAAALDLTYVAGRDATFGERQEVDNQAAGRGTLQHEVLMSRRAVPYGPGETTTLEVACRATAGELADEIPYALLVTIETPASLALPIYEEVRQAIATRVAVRPAG